MAGSHMLVALILAMITTTNTAAVNRRKNTTNNTTVMVPSELLVRLVEVTHSLRNLMPRHGTISDLSTSSSSSSPDTATQGLQGTSGEERILTLALTQHALLQNRMEQLLTETGRCEAQVEALKEDKEELKREINALKDRLRQILSSPRKFPAKIDDTCRCKQTDDILPKGTKITDSTLPAATTTTTSGVGGRYRGGSSGELAATTTISTIATINGGTTVGTTAAATTTTTSTTTAATTTDTVVLLGSGVRVKDCAGHQLAGATENGVYEIYPSECRAVRVWCDLTTAGGGWTVFLNRQEAKTKDIGQENFTRIWNEYKNGFGDVSGEYWLGNEVLHKLTTRGPHILRVDAEDFQGSKRWGEWKRFRVEEESQGYKLLAVMYDTNSTLGDGLLWHSGMQFSTIDRDNDKHKGSCAHEYKGGFWYNVCHNANPTGVLINSDQFDSVGWVYWSPKRYKWASLRYLALKLRPKSFGSASSDQAGPGDCTKPE